MSTLNNQIFSLERANDLFRNDEITECKNYIKSYFFPLTTGQHIFIDYGVDGKPKYEITEDKTIKQVYFNRLPKDINNWYFRTYDKLKTITCELNKPVLFDNYFNTCPSFLHQVKPYDSYPAEMKSKVQIMLDYVKTIWASGNQDQYTFIIQWFANMARGGKNQSILYLRSDEGIGKSTFTDFIMKYVIGPKLSLMCGSGPLLSNFNILLYCKLLVVFEELENFSVGQWQVASARLKRDATADTCQYEKKNETQFVAKNISNYIINSNVDAIKNDEGRRYFILDLSNVKKGDHAFFKMIYSTCHNAEVGEAFFSYLNTIDLTNYHDQAFPSTKAKQDAIVKRLDTVARFIKERYVLKNNDLKLPLKSLYEEYTNYCSGINQKALCKIDLNNRLAAYKMKGIKSGNDHNKFVYSHEQLLEIANTHHWLHSTDNFEPTAEELFGEVKEESPLDQGIKDVEQRDEELEQLRARNETLQKRIAELEAMSNDTMMRRIIADAQQDQKDINELVAENRRRKSKPLDKKTMQHELFELSELWG